MGIFQDLLKNQKTRAIVFQILAVFLLIMFFWYTGNNALVNIAKRGIQTGFSFLGDEAGFNILLTLIEYSTSSTYLDVFIVGILNSILVSVVSIFIATLLGFLVGVARVSSNWLLIKISSAYVEVIRNIPLLLQIFFWYFVLINVLPSLKQSYSLFNAFFLNSRGAFMPNPVFSDNFVYVVVAIVLAIVITIFLNHYLHKKQDETGQQFHNFYIGLAIIILLPLITFLSLDKPILWDIPALKKFNFAGGIHILPEFIALTFALSIYTSAFIAEVVRAGIQSVSHGQVEASSSLGLSNAFTLRYIIIPQAMRAIIPPLTSQYVNLTKNSSLATAIGYPDLVAVFAGTALNQSGQAIEIMLMTMLVYLTLSLTTSIFMNWYNARKELITR